MIEEAEQLVYHLMHYALPSKEHQSMRCPPFIWTQEKAKSRVTREGREWEPTPLPLPASPYTLCLLQTGRATLSSFSSCLYRATKSPFQAYKPKWKMLKSQQVLPGGHSTQKKNVFVVWWDFRRSLEWLWTYNYGNPHSRSAVCQWEHEEPLPGSKVSWSTTKIQLLSGKSLHSLPLNWVCSFFFDCTTQKHPYFCLNCSIIPAIMPEYLQKGQQSLTINLEWIGFMSTWSYFDKCAMKSKQSNV